MVRRKKRSALIICARLMMVAMASAQMQRQGKALSVQGYPGQAAVVQFQGRTLVEVQDLARITGGSLNFQSDQIVLTLPDRDASEAVGRDTGQSGFSRGFKRAAIEAMASIREWGGMLLVTVQNGYEVQTSLAGNTIVAYQNRAAESVALASTAASTDADYRGLELLKNEFNNVQVWAEKYIEARRSLSAANLTMSESALTNDQEAQKTVRCGQFLAQMFASGTYQDDAACH